jgi:hypothetical protein
MLVFYGIKILLYDEQFYEKLQSFISSYCKVVLMPDMPIRGNLATVSVDNSVKF